MTRRFSKMKHSNDYAIVRTNWFAMFPVTPKVDAIETAAYSLVVERGKHRQCSSQAGFELSKDTFREGAAQI